MRKPKTRIERLEDINARVILTICMERIWTLAIFLLVAFILGVIALRFFIAPQYTARLSVAPVQSSGTDIGSSLGGLSSLASMAGVSLPQSQGGTHYRLYLTGITSRSTADELAKRTDIMSQLYAAEWNPQTRTWHEPPPGVMGYAIWGVKAVLGLRQYPWQPPDGARLHDYIGRFVAVDQDPKKPVATISYRSSNPQFAVRFLAALHEITDNQLRARTLVRNQQYVSYLTQRLPTVTNADHRQTLADILSNQEKMMMMASASVAYAAEPFGLPSVGDKPDSPVSSKVLMVFMTIGGVLGLALVLMQALGWIGSRERRVRAEIHGVAQPGE